MSTPHDISALIGPFLSTYDTEAMDQVWKGLSQRFHKFWNERVLSDSTETIPDSECDEIIRILDRNGKGNTKDSESVARAMVPQGAWRRMMNEFHDNKKLGALVTKVLSESEPVRKAALIDELYKKNAGQKNNLTGPSGNTVGAFLTAYDPINNLSIISLNDRRAVIEFLGLSVPFDWDAASMGIRIAVTNKVILDGVRALGLDGSGRTISKFFYSPEVKPLWKGEHTVKRADKDVNVTVPTIPDVEEEDESDKESVRESMQIQALIARIGTLMGYSIWLPKADRGRVLKAWKAEPDELLDHLPLGYDSTTMKTVEQIDVLWLRKRSIVRAFEVEHTTSVYSGLLRMADLVALQPDIYIKLHIVAPVEKREKVLQEIQRPVFSLLEGRALSEMCTYLSYDNIKDIAELKHLEHLSDKVIEDYEERAE
jgi:hypothetical protein